MKRFTFYVCMVVFLPQQLYAQISTSVADKHNHGSTARVVKCNFLPPGANGGNQSWDFSNLTTQGNDSPTIAFISPPAGLPFPSASIAWKIKEGSSYKYDLYEHTSDGVYQLGEVDSSGSTPDTFSYTNSMRIMKLPATYGDMFTDTFVLKHGMDSVSGTMDVTVEGFGSLALPHITHSNTIRVKKVQMGKGLIGGNSVTIRNVTYAWYDNVNSTPLLKLDSMTTNSNTTREAWYLFNETANIPAATQNKIPVRASFINNRLVISEGTKTGHLYSVRLFDITGRMIYAHEFTGGNRMYLDVGNDVPNAMYIVTITQDNDMHQRNTQKVYKR